MPMPSTVTVGSTAIAQHIVEDDLVLRQAEGARRADVVLAHAPRASRRAPCGRDSRPSPARARATAGPDDRPGRGSRSPAPMAGNQRSQTEKISSAIDGDDEGRHGDHRDREHGRDPVEQRARIHRREAAERNADEDRPAHGAEDEGEGVGQQRQDDVQHRLLAQHVIAEIAGEHGAVEAQQLDIEGLIQPHALAQGLDQGWICPRTQGDGEGIAGDDVDHQEENGDHTATTATARPSRLAA